MEKLDKFQKIKKEYARLCELCEYQEVLLDKKLFLKVEKQKNLLQPLATTFDYLQNLQSELAELEKCCSLASGEEKILFENERILCLQKICETKTKLNQQMFSLEAEWKNIVVEIIDKTKSPLFETLLNGYCEFCRTNNLEVENEHTEQGCRLHISGFGADAFENEIGKHLEATTHQACLVFVFEAQQREIFDEKDVEYQACRSSGAGGQHINKTESAIKAIHAKTKISATCQDERSQFQNKQKALLRLKEKVEDFYNCQTKTQFDKQRKIQLPLCERVIKTYDFSTREIEKFDGRKISLDHFVSGKILN